MVLPLAWLAKFMSLMTWKKPLWKQLNKLGSDIDPYSPSKRIYYQELCEFIVLVWSDD